MAYQPYDRNPSGIVFFGTSTTDQVFESNANFTFGNDILRVPNIVIDNDGELGSATTPNAVTIASDGTVTIAGDLTVNGTTTTVNSTTVEIADNILLLNKGVTGVPSLDAGLEIERGDSTNVSLLWDEGIDSWTFTNNGSTFYSMWTGLTVGGDVNSDEEIVEGETLTLTGGSGITTSMSTNEVTFDVDATVISGQSLITSADSADHILVLDGTDGVLKKITKGNFVSDLGGGTVTSVGITSDTMTVTNSPITGAGDIDIEVKVDNVTIQHNGSNQLEVKDGGIDGSKIALSVDSSFANNDVIDSDINLVTAGVSNLTVKLPSPSAGKVVKVKKADSGVGHVVVAQNSAETIDGAASKTLYYQYESMTFVSDGTNWFVF